MRSAPALDLRRLRPRRVEFKYTLRRLFEEERGWLQGTEI
jgi:hypothetical protein